MTQHTDHNNSETCAETPELKLAGRWYVVFVLMIVVLFSWLDRQIIVMLIDPIKRDLGISEVQISLLTGFAFAFVYASAGIPLGWAADRFNRRWIIFTGIVIWGLATASCGLARSFWQLFLGRVAVGVGEATLSPSAISMIGDIFPRNRRTFALSMMSIGAPVGAGLSFAVGGAIASAVSHNEGIILPLIGEVRAWQVAFLAVGLPGPLLALLMLTIKEPKRRETIEQQHASNTSVQKTAFFDFLKTHKKFIGCYMAGYGCLSMGLYAIQSWGPIYMSRVFGWSGAQIGASFGAVIATGVVLALISGGLIVDYFYSRGMKDAHMRLYSIAALIVLPLALGSIAANNPWIFLAGVFLWQLTISGFSSAGMVAMQMIAPNEFRGRLIGIWYFVAMVGGLGFGPLIVAMLTQYVFKDDAMVGWSLALTILVIYPSASFFLWKGAKYMRELSKAEPLIADR